MELRCWGTAPSVWCSSKATSCKTPALCLRLATLCSAYRRTAMTYDAIPTGLPSTTFMVLQFIKDGFVCSKKKLAPQTLREVDHTSNLASSSQFAIDFLMSLGTFSKHLAEGHNVMKQRIGRTTHETVMRGPAMTISSLLALN